MWPVIKKKKTNRYQSSLFILLPTFHLKALKPVMLKLVNNDLIFKTNPCWLLNFNILKLTCKYTDGISESEGSSCDLVSFLTPIRKLTSWSWFPVLSCKNKVFNQPVISITRYKQNSNSLCRAKKLELYECHFLKMHPFLIQLLQPITQHPCSLDAAKWHFRGKWQSTQHA